MNSAIERLLQLRVRDVMQPNVIELAAGENIAQAATKLLDRQISGAPVVDEHGHCVGLLSATDFVRWTRERHSTDDSCLHGRHHHLTARSPSLPLAIEEDSRDSVRSHMTTAVQSIAADASMTEAARRMCAAHVHRLPVLDQNGRVQGIVTTLDIVASLLGAISE